MPDELLLSPQCKLWSQIQNITARAEDQQADLQYQRQEHHDARLQFVAMAYKEQVDGARHAHIEQPEKAPSWKIVALRDQPGFHTIFDQCMYGCCCLVKKGTGLRTTKAAMAAAMNLRKAVPLAMAEGRHTLKTTSLVWHQHCLPPSMPQNYLNAGSMPLRWMNSVCVRAIDQALHRLQSGCCPNVRTVQRHHRNLGHPSAEALTELLESREASEAILEAARKHQCVACLRYKKPNQVAPASIK